MLLEAHRAMSLLSARELATATTTQNGVFQHHQNNLETMLA